MNPMIENFQTLLIRDLKAFAKEIESFPEDSKLWLTVPGVNNSAGNLAMHVAGNLQHFVGALLGNTGYVRNRELEFSQRSGTREQVIEELERTIQVVTTVFSSITEERMLQEFPQSMGGKQYTTSGFLIWLSMHLAYHLGQANYLRRMIL